MNRCSVSLKERHIFKNMLTYEFITYQLAEIQQSDGLQGSHGRAW